MRRMMLAAVPLVVLATSCGGGDSGGSTADWCDLATEIEATSDGLDNIDFTDPDAVKAAFETFSSQLDEAKSAAPSEIKDAVAESATAISAVIDELKKVDYKFLELDQATIEELGTANQEASDKIEAFNKEECGIDPDADSSGSDDSSDDSSGSGDSSDDTSADSGTGDTTADDADSSLPDAGGTLGDSMAALFVQQGFTQDEADCIVDNLDLTTINSAADLDQSKMLELFETCGMDLERLAELGGG
jgi:hypothetical protein